MEKEGRLLFIYKEGGVTPSDTMLTLGLAAIAEKGLDAVIGDASHGWYCIVEDIESGLKDSRWGATKKDAKAKAINAISVLIENWEYEEEKHRKVRAEEVLEIKKQENAQNKNLYKRISKSDSESIEAYLIRIIVIYVALPFAILFLIGQIIAYFIIPLLFCSLSILPLIFSFFRRGYRKLFLWLSFGAAIYVVLDFQIGWISDGIMTHQSSLKNIIPASVLLNQLSGLVAFYLLFRIQPEALENTVNAAAHEFNKRNAILLLLLLTLGSISTWTLLNKRHSTEAEVKLANMASSNLKDLQSSDKTDPKRDEFQNITPDYVIEKTNDQNSNPQLVQKNDQVILQPISERKQKKQSIRDEITLSDIASDLVGRTFGLIAIKNVSEIKSLKSNSKNLNIENQTITYQISFVLGDDEVISKAELTYHWQNNVWQLIKVQDRHSDSLIEKNKE
jgi:predicted GNAT family acetyltransferase